MISLARVTIMLAVVGFVLAQVVASPTGPGYQNYEFEDVSAAASSPDPLPDLTPSPADAPSLASPEPMDPVPKAYSTGSQVTLSDGTTASSTGDTTVSAAATSTEGAASANTEQGSVLAVGGPGFGLGFAGILDGFSGLGALASPSM